MNSRDIKEVLNTLAKKHPTLVAGDIQAAAITISCLEMADVIIREKGLNAGDDTLRVELARLLLQAARP